MVTGKPYKPSRFTRFVLYPIVGFVFFAVLVVILIMANGYRFTFNNNKVGLVKTGMLILTSRPFDGQISLNNKTTKYRSGFYLLPTKISAHTPGFYDVEIKKNGYRTWRNRLEIIPNMVTWANYALLFAEKLNISKIDVPQGQVVAVSQNGRHMLYANTTETSFDIKSFDTNNLSITDFWPQTGISDTWLIKPNILTAKFSAGNNKALLGVQNGSKVEYVVLDTTGSQIKIIKLSEILAKSFDKGLWSYTNNSELYLRENGNVYLVNINNTSLASPLASNVVDFMITESKQIVYVEKGVDSVYSLNMMDLDGNKKERIVSSMVPSKDYQLDHSSQHNIITVLNKDTHVLESYYVGNATKKYSLKMGEGVLGFEWSKNGQKLHYWGKDFVRRYDWEKGKEINTPLEGNTLNVGWYFDENHYLITTDKGIYVIDYDGTNRVNISDVTTLTTVLDQGNNNIIHSIKESDGQTSYYKYISEF